MKKKRLSSKLALNKSTIAHLGNMEKQTVKGGYLPTDLEETCYTWCGACLTDASCTPTCYYSCYCDTINHWTCDPLECREP